MSRAFRAHVASPPPLRSPRSASALSRADLNFNTEHDATYTLGSPMRLPFRYPELLYEAADTVTRRQWVHLATTPSTSRRCQHVQLERRERPDGQRRHHDSTTATATLTSDGTPGTVGYNYVSNDGQGFFSVSAQTVLQQWPPSTRDRCAALVESIGLQGSCDRFVL